MSTTSKNQSGASTEDENDVVLKEKGTTSVDTAVAKDSNPTVGRLFDFICRYKPHSVRLGLIDTSKEIPSKRNGRCYFTTDEDGYVDSVDDSGIRWLYMVSSAPLDECAMSNDAKYFSLESSLDGVSFLLSSRFHNKEAFIHVIDYGLIQNLVYWHRGKIDLKPHYYYKEEFDRHCVHETFHKRDKELFRSHQHNYTYIQSIDKDS